MAPTSGGQDKNSRHFLYAENIPSKNQVIFPKTSWSLTKPTSTVALGCDTPYVNVLEQGNITFGVVPAMQATLDQSSS